MSSLDPLLIFFSEIPDSLGYSTASLHYITFQDTSMRAATRKEMSMSPFQQLLCLCRNGFPTHALNYPHSPDPTLPPAFGHLKRKRKTIMPHLPHTSILCKPPPSILPPTPPTPAATAMSRSTAMFSTPEREGGGFFY
ncbi:hypothetical protein HBH75_036750 [Parastagonospora nodorum]|nr:hypothetical protein HBH75_036750 [Parastagonospora nodorum]KAH4964208.1 hypothetical protein HBI78_115020 [Parastagonospora nodorum]